MDAFLDWFKAFGTNFLESAAVLLAGLVVIKLVRKVLTAVFHKTKLDGTATSFLISLLQAVLFLILFFTVMNVFKIDTTSLAAILTASGLALGLALQDSLSNLSSGLIILATKPFKENDHVIIGSTEGKIKKIRITTTEILTFDNITIILPNSMVAKSEIQNMSAKSTRRIDFFVPVSYDDDPDKVKRVLSDLIASDIRVLKRPEPTVIINELAPTSVNYRVRAWVESGDYWDILFGFNEKVFAALKSNGITVPYNRLYEMSAKPAKKDGKQDD